MLVLPLCKQFCPEKLPVQPNVCLGDGADGEVFTISGELYKVIKLGLQFDTNDRLIQIRKVMDYIIHNQPTAYVHVYEYGYLGAYFRKLKYWDNGEQQIFLYYYIMEKLEKISDDEKRVFHSILSHEDRAIKKDFSAVEIKKMLQGMSCGLDFDAEKITLFCNNIKAAPLYHSDIHVRNIMKDELGNFKLIDLDRIELENNND